MHGISDCEINDLLQVECKYLPNWEIRILRAVHVQCMLYYRKNVYIFRNADIVENASYWRKFRGWEMF